MDYTPVIRAQITREVIQLISRFRTNHRIEPEYVDLGYLMNSHKGREVFERSETIAGLPIKGDPYDGPRSVAVRADNVEIPIFEDGDDPEYAVPLDWYKDNLVEASTW